VREQDTPRTPLQKFEIDQYSLVGIIWGIDRPRALVEDPEGVGHVMEIGTYIGRNWGKVTQITNGEAVVTEEYQTIDGELVVNNISMTLPVAGDGSVR
jgi:type IV pilus assembly protein PilP